jgi:solute carrier family 25 citrate transporter 1
MSASAPVQKKKSSALRSILAGSSAGAVEIAITYPAEFAKTRSQLNRRLAEGKKLPWPPFGRQWYAGCTTLIIGNSIKAGVRFVAFDAYKNMLSSPDGTISGPATVIAGFGAGVTESLLAVTPFESIKTQLIDDRKAAQPRMRGFLHGSRLIAREKGIRGFFQGFTPTTARQAANSAVRFSSYTSLRQLAQSYVAPGEKLGALSTFGIGGVAGVITVYVFHISSNARSLAHHLTTTDTSPCLWTLSRQGCSPSKQKQSTKTASTVPLVSSEKRVSLPFGLVLYPDLVASS